MKYLLLAVILYLLWRLWRGRLPAGQPRGKPQKPVENMLTCAHCGVHFPEGDALRRDGQAFCCAAHRAAAPARD